MDIKFVYLRQIPIRLFYGLKMDSISKADGVMQVTYYQLNYVRVNFKEMKYDWPTRLFLILPANNYSRS